MKKRISFKNEVKKIMSRKGFSGLEWIVIIAFLAIALGWIQLPSFGPSETAPSAPAAPSVPSAAPGCQVEDTSMNLNPQDIFAKGTEVDVRTAYWINGEYVGKDDAQGTLTVSPGDDMVLLSWLNGKGTTSPDVGDAGLHATIPWYGTKKSLTVPCAGTYEANMYVYKADYNTTNTTLGLQDLTVTIFNEDDQVVAEVAETNAPNIGTSIYSMQIKLKVGSYLYFSNPESDKGIMICFDAGSELAKYDEIKITSHGAEAASVPEILLGTADWCWELTEVTHMKDGESIYIDVDLDPDDSTEPTGGDIHFWIMDTEYYLHTKTGELLGPDYEDNDGNQIGLAVCTTLAELQCNNEIAIA